MHITHYIKDIVEGIVLVSALVGAVLGYVVHTVQVRIRPPRRFRREVRS